MTAPTSPGVVGASGGLIDSSGLPNFGAISTTGAVAGQVDIWNLPSDLQNYGGKIWFDTQHGTTTVSSQTIPGEVARDQIPLAADAGTTTKQTSKDIYMTPQQLLAQYYALAYNDPEKFFALQAQLAQLDSRVQPTGRMDAATNSALVGAMQGWVRTVGSGVAVPFAQYLSDSAATAAKYNTKIPKGAAGVAVTDPVALREAAQSAAERALGQGLTSKQLDAFVSQFQQQQVTAATATTGRVKMPSMAEDADAFAQQANPQEYTQNKADMYRNILVNMFAPGASNRPSTTQADLVPSIQGAS